MNVNENMSNSINNKNDMNIENNINKNEDTKNSVNNNRNINDKTKNLENKENINEDDKKNSVIEEDNYDDEIINNKNRRRYPTSQDLWNTSEFDSVDNMTKKEENTEEKYDTNRSRHYSEQGNNYYNEKKKKNKNSKGYSGSQNYRDRDSTNYNSTSSSKINEDSKEDIKPYVNKTQSQRSKQNKNNNRYNSRNDNYTFVTHQNNSVRSTTIPSSKFTSLKAPKEEKKVVPAKPRRNLMKLALSKRTDVYKMNFVYKGIEISLGIHYIAGSISKMESALQTNPSISFTKRMGLDTEFSETLHKRLGVVGDRSWVVGIARIDDDSNDVEKIEDDYNNLDVLVDTFKDKYIAVLNQYSSETFIALIPPCHAFSSFLNEIFVEETQEERIIMSTTERVSCFLFIMFDEESEFEISEMN